MKFKEVRIIRKEYSGNNKIALYGNPKDIAQAEAVLNTLNGLEPEFVSFTLKNEGEIRLIIQEAIDKHKIKATIMVAGNTVYPFEKIVKQYDRLRKSGRLEKMTKEFYQFLHLNFDIAYYNKHGYVDHYDNSFEKMKRNVLDCATTTRRFTDVQRILDYIQGQRKDQVA